MESFVDLVMTTISRAASSANETDSFLKMSRLADIFPATEALLALKEIIILSPKPFTEASALKRLIGKSLIAFLRSEIDFISHSYDVAAVRFVGNVQSSGTRNQTSYT